MTPHRSPSPTVAAGGSSRRCCQTTRAPQWCCEEHLGGTPSPTRLGGCSIGDRAWRRGIPWWSPVDSCGGVAVEDVGPVPASTRRKLGQRGVHGLLWWRTGARAKDTGARHTARHGPCLDKPGTRVGAGGAPPPPSGTGSGAVLQPALCLCRAGVGVHAHAQLRVCRRCWCRCGRSDAPTSN